MAKLKPWYHAVKLREDLQDGRPLDAQEFAVHLDHVRQGKAHVVYREPRQFFERTYLTGSLLDLAAQTVRRLSGITHDTSAVFNMSTQFGGGKTHSLTMLYHLAQGGSRAADWMGVDAILRQAGVKSVPQAATAVIVGTEVDLLTGRGGPGEPTRKTLWGEIAWQLGGEKSFAVVSHHDEKGVVPGGDVVEQMLPEGPVLILLDEMLSYMSRGRRRGANDDFYNFLQVLAGTIGARNNAILCVSIPFSATTEMTTEDQTDFERVKKQLDRVGKAIQMSEKTEFAEIIRRRLFDWNGLPEEGRRVASAYAEWARDQGSGLSGLDGTHSELVDRFSAMYPFHPAALSVFERKWQTLPRFQRTRGVLRLLALWVAHAYQEQHRRGSDEPLLSLGSAPLHDNTFRAAVFEQLGEDKLVAPVTTDIAGKLDSHAVRLDEQDKEHIRKARLHQKVATTIFFESNGGQSQDKAFATLAEVKTAVGTPDLNLMEVDSALEDLLRVCFYLTAERNRYQFSLNPNLNQVLVSRRGNIRSSAVTDSVRKAVVELFQSGARSVTRRYFPERSGDIQDEPELTLAILGLETPKGDPATSTLMESIVRDCGSSGRTFKSAIIFVVPEAAGAVREAGQTLLAWEDIQGDPETVKRLSKAQVEQLGENVTKTKKEFSEALARSYRHLYLLGKDNRLKHQDFDGQNRGNFVEQILARLEKIEELTDKFAAHKLVPLWPATATEWSTKEARDAFFASPLLPRLRSDQALQRTISDGVSKGLLGYGVLRGAQVELTHFNEPLAELQVEISEEAFIVKPERAKELRAPVPPPPLVLDGGGVVGGGGSGGGDGGGGADGGSGGGYGPGGGGSKPPVRTGPRKVKVHAEVPYTEFHTFYTGVINALGRTGDRIRIEVTIEAESERGFSPALLEDTVGEALVRLFKTDAALTKED